MGFRRALGSVGILALGAAASMGIGGQAASAAPVPLVGTFAITAGTCSGGVPSGTYLRMVLSGGSNSAGPYFSNSDSTCSDNTYTPLPPGTRGGLVTGAYQPEPSPAFDSSGNALSGQITAPVPFEGVKFATSTNPVDPQTGLSVPVPSIEADGTSLSGNLEAFAVSWNNQQFNQGSPKPGGSSPGNTTPVSGSYTPATGAYVLEWSSQIVGGPFNGFSAFWHLTGTFTPSGSGAASAPQTESSSTPAGATGSNPPVSSHGAGSATAASGGTSLAGQPSAAGAATSTTTVTPQATKPGISRHHLVLSSHTTLSTSGGWNTPAWVVAVLALLAALGLGGVVWSERVRRRQGETT
jgi:hypothetical protein